MRRCWPLILAAMVCPAWSVAQPGSVDGSFNVLDIGYGNGDGANDAVRSIAFQPDGKIVIGGYFTSYNGSPCNFIARLNADGSMDDSFDTGTGADQAITCTIIQPDGKMVLGGNFTSLNGIPCGHMARLNSDGSMDGGFNQGTGADNSLWAIARQPDGAMIIAGGFSSYNGTGRNHVARILADGSLDTAFDPGSGTDGVVKAIALQPDGKILLGGIFNTFNGMPSANIARINTDGSLDNTFQIGAGPDSYVTSIAVQPDGKVIVGGYFTLFNGIMANRITRLNADGSVDSTFNSGTGASNNVWATAIQPDGKIIIGGEFLSYNGTAQARITRLNADGSMDPFFNSGTGADYTVSSIVVQGDGRTYMGGYFSSYNGTARNSFMRLNMDGSLDSTFNRGTGANFGVRSILVQTDGKAVLSGEFTWCDGTVRHRIARIGQDGSLDMNFDPGAGTNGRISSAAIQPDGKIIVGGAFTSFNGMPVGRIARINTDGSPDSAFNTAAGVNLPVEAMALQTDGKIIIGGMFSLCNGTSRNYLARLNSDGSLDTTFNPGSGADEWVRAIALQQDGKILIGGDFLTYDGTPCNRIVRLNEDGSIDTSFTTDGGPNGNVMAIAAQPDGKIIIGGNFSFYSGIPCSLIARLGQDGSWDSSFNQGTGMEGTMVRAITLTANGKILVGGRFDAYGGILRHNLVMLNADGSVDQVFIPGAGPDQDVWAIAIQPDGNILIGGDFVSYDGVGRNRFARLIGDMGTSIVSTHEVSSHISAWPNPLSNGELKVMVPWTGTTSIQVFNSIGRQLKSHTTVLHGTLLQLNLGDDLTTGHYTVRLTAAGGSAVIPLVIQ